MKNNIEKAVNMESNKFDAEHRRETADENIFRNEFKEAKDPGSGKLITGLSEIPGIGIAPAGFFIARDMREPSPVRLLFPFTLTDHPLWWIQSMRRKKKMDPKLSGASF